MNKIYLIICLYSFILSQDRSTIFNTGSPSDLSQGYTISSQQSIANRFTTSNNYVLEAMAFYMTMQSTEANLIVSIREDNNGVPGELVSDLSSWEYSLDPLNITGYNVIVTTDLCIYLESDNNYWWRIDAADIQTDATWVHSDIAFYTFASSNNQTEWTTALGYAGSGGIWAEQIYELPYNLGDVNFDFVVNVIDIVAIVSHIMGINPLSDDALPYADLTSDGEINVVDIVALVSSILHEQAQNPDFIVEDINPSSEYYSQNIGPSFFDGQVSCYYFGKQGWGTCKARFGVINDLYNDLLNDGITDVKMMGVNGYQYINDSVNCMICDDSCTSSTCEEGPRILPWSQDYDDGINCEDTNSELCEGGDEDGDVWDLWDISLRDFVILDRDGLEFARINLTYNNPDPDELGECSGNYQKIKDLILAARNR